MRFFVDQCVPESVSRVLEKHGHEVQRLRESIGPDSPDTLVAAVAESNDAILVTLDADFKKINSRYGIGKSRYRHLSLLRFERCRESETAKRLDEAMSLIQHEWDVGHDKSETQRRLYVVITKETIRTYR